MTTGFKTLKELLDAMEAEGRFSADHTRRDELASYISDTYKEVNGFRPRFYDWDAMSEAELIEVAEGLARESAEQDAAAERHAEGVRAIREGKVDGYLVLDPRLNPDDPYDAAYIRDMERLGNFDHLSICLIEPAPANTAIADALRRAVAA